METIIVDTDVIIDFSQGHTKPLEGFLLEAELNKELLVVSTITLFEFYSGYTLTSEEEFEKANILFSKFKLQEVNGEIAHLAAKLSREKRLHQKITASDILIAATALYLDARLLTKNKKHFRAVPGLKFAS